MTTFRHPIWSALCMGLVHMDFCMNPVSHRNA